MLPNPPTLVVERLTPIGAESTWGKPMPHWYWRLRNARQALVHHGWGPPPVAFNECPYNQGRGTCSLGCWEEPACHTNASGRYGWPRRPLDLHRIARRLGSGS